MRRRLRVAGFSFAQRQLPASKGQSLVETIIACGIIVTAVSAALTLSTSAIRAQRQSEALILGGNLAREGIEAVRSIRDSNWMAGVQWDSGLFGGAANNDYTGIPIIDPTTALWTVNFAAADTINDDPSRVWRYTAASGNAVIGMMVQAASVPASTVNANFRRLITLDALCDNGSGGYTIVTSGATCGANRKIGIRVTSTVQWVVANATKSLSIEERMFDWH